MVDDVAFPIPFDKCSIYLRQNGDVNGITFYDFSHSRHQPLDFIPLRVTGECLCDGRDVVDEKKVSSAAHDERTQP
jgi:hypothetical protein